MHTVLSLIVCHERGEQTLTLSTASLYSRHHHHPPSTNLINQPTNLTTQPNPTQHDRGKASAVYASTSLWHDIKNIRALRTFRGDVERATSNLDLAADDSRISRSGKPVYKVVFTGGPCGGKSSSLASVVDRLSSLGFKTYASPEIATILIGAGARPVFPGWTPETLARFQESIIRTSIAIEDALVSIALECDEPSVILLDRGISDGAAYVDAQTWDNILGNCGLTVDDAMARYDCVVHLVTAALVGRAEGNREGGFEEEQSEGGREGGKKNSAPCALCVWGENVRPTNARLMIFF